MAGSPVNWLEILLGGGSVALLGTIGTLFKAAQDAKRQGRQDTQSAEASLRQELRDLLTSERAQFEKELEGMRTEMDKLRTKVDELSGRLTNLIGERERLRMTINYHERTQGLPPTVWPPDGGTP